MFLFIFAAKIMQKFDLVSEMRILLSFPSVRILFKLNGEQNKLAYFLS